MEDPAKVIVNGTKRTGGEDHVLLIFYEKLLVGGFRDANSAVLIRGGAQILAVTKDGCCSRQGSSDLCLECRILAPMWIPQPGGTDPSPHQRGLSGFHHWPLGLSGADPQYRLG
ncbi:hypothetical protein H920_03497 [Fukomys damarensis]|uniref:Uncharacterized protein n=1 Tax=Fukomys damarensis TaxID=885580 RepID=A0A091DSG8_FUKDA|nr:hypothetical protein H920_03497 [Fukomys damarensis]